jgi:DNA-binding GntR family transcriptional regulator
VLSDFLSALISRTSLILALYETPGAVACGARDHAAILEAVEAGDAEGARRQMEEHLHACEARLRVGGADAPVDFTRLFAPIGPAAVPRRTARDNVAG